MSATPNLGLTLLQTGQARKEVTVNGDLDLLDAWAGLSSVAISGSHALSAAEARAAVIEATGALSGAANLTTPDATPHLWALANKTTGGFAVTLKTPSGTGTAVAAGKRAVLYCDGVNVVRAAPDT